MSDKTRGAQISPYDLSAIRRSASAATLKAPVPMRQPYTLASSQRLIKSTVMLRAKKFA
jgi:hypothetical protein